MIHGKPIDRRMKFIENKEVPNLRFLWLRDNEAASGIIMTSRESMAIVSIFIGIVKCKKDV